MEELIEHPDDYGIYIVDRRMKSVDESVNQLTDQMFQFTQKTRRQRINQRNRTERLSPFLDWKVLGLEYVKARQLALRRAYPTAFDNDGAFEAATFDETKPKVPRPISAPPSPRYQGGATPGDLGSLQEGMEVLHTVCPYYIACSDGVG
jgi:glycogen(starch) synthase